MRQKTPKRDKKRRGGKDGEAGGWSGGVTHHTTVVFFVFLSFPTGSLEVQSSRTGKK